MTPCILLDKDKLYYTVLYVNVRYTVLVVVRMRPLQRHQVIPEHLLCLAVISSRSLLLVEFSHAKQIQWFLPWGHGSVICQAKCFLRLAMCTHQVSVTCKSHFTKCQKKAFHCNLRGRGANITQ